MKTALLPLLTSLLAIAVVYQSGSDQKEKRTTTDSRRSTDQQSMSGVNIVKNGDFEVDLDEDGMADYWQFSGDEGVTVTWARDKGFVGQFSQKLTCASFTHLSPASHAMLCQINTVRLHKGKWYRISFAAKQEGIQGRAAQVAISNMKPWRSWGVQ